MHHLGTLIGAPLPQGQDPSIVTLDLYLGISLPTAVELLFHWRGLNSFTDMYACDKKEKIMINKALFSDYCNTNKK